MESDQEVFDRVSSGIRQFKSAAEALGPLIREAEDKQIWKGRYDSWKEYIEIECGITDRWARAILKRPEFLISEKSDLLIPKRNLVPPNFPVKVQVTPETLCENSKSQKWDLQAELMSSSSSSFPVEADVELDETGYPVPDCVLSLWERKGEVKVLLSDLSRVKSVIERAQEEDDPLFRELLHSAVISDVKNAYNGIKTALAYAVCPYCQGLNFESCEACKRRGFMSKFAWETIVPSEMKAMRRERENER